MRYKGPPLVVGNFTFRVDNPEGIDVAGLREVVEVVKYKGLKLRWLELGLHR